MSKAKELKDRELKRILNKLNQPEIAKWTNTKVLHV
jgi:hypothetical protein